MSDHIVDQIADYLEGRLAPDATRAFESHLEECEACAADVEFARAFQTGAVEQGLMHIRPGRIVALADDPSVTTEIEERHLMDCSSCRSELEWVRTSSASDVADGGGSPAGRDSGLHPTRDRKSRWAFSRGWGLGLVTAAVAVLAVLLMLPDGTVDPERARGLARIEPIPVNITRSPVSPGSFEEARLIGLESYRDGDYGRAAERLDEAVDLRPDAAELYLYLGSAAMLDNDYEPATRYLQTCIERAGNDALRDEAMWQLANAYLAGGDVNSARTTLQRIRDAGGARAGDSTRLLTRLSK
jgi:hypothetical protein